MKTMEDILKEINDRQFRKTRFPFEDQPEYEFTEFEPVVFKALKYTPPKFELPKIEPLPIYTLVVPQHFPRLVDDSIMLGQRFTTLEFAPLAPYMPPRISTLVSPMPYQGPGDRI